MNNVRSDYISVHDDVKSEVLKSLGGWLKFCNKFSESSLKTFEEALNGKEVLKLAALKGLSIGHSNISLFSNVRQTIKSAREACPTFRRLRLCRFCAKPLKLDCQKFPLESKAFWLFLLFPSFQRIILLLVFYLFFPSLIPFRRINGQN